MAHVLDPTRRSLLLVIVLVAAVTACDWGREAPPCDCPEFEEAVDSLDWAPGLTLSSVGTESAGAAGEWSVQRVWNTPESEHLLSRLETALNHAGFAVDNSEPRRLTATKDNLTIWAGRNEAVGEVAEEFFVRATIPKGEPGDAYVDMEELADVLSRAS